MKTKNTFWIIAGIINIITFIIHITLGQIDLISPLLESMLNLQIKTELLGVWHMASLFLIASSIIYFKYGMNKKMKENPELISFISYLYLGFSLAFILASAYNSILAPQWILLFPIGLLGIMGTKKLKTNA